MNISPWTGWVVFDEFDIMLLGTLVAGYMRLANSPHRPGRSVLSGRALAVLLGMGAMALYSLSRAVADAGGMVFDWFAGYTDPLNSVRVIKGECYALLCMPLLYGELSNQPALAQRRMSCGMVAGLGIVAVAVLWERLAFVDLLDFSRPYRAVALFWEMHVGGEAIDAYLALASPFAVWAVVSARRPLTWFGAAALALLTAYAVLTTFSRGLYMAVALSLLVLAILLLGGRKRQLRAMTPNIQPVANWRSLATLALWLALCTEVCMALFFGGYMLERMSSAPDDLGGRILHWQRGLAALNGTADWWLGKGPGRLPSHYARSGPMEELSGQAHSARETDGLQRENRFVTLIGPATQARIGGQFALTQRVPAPASDQNRVRLDVRSQTNVQLQLEWCARHLLYDADCQTLRLHVAANPRWQTVDLHLTVTPTTASWYAPQLALFSLSVTTPGGQADIDNVHLQGASDVELLANGDFSQYMAHWLGCAQSYFLPWHIDNLFLELLIERGLIGLLVFCLLAVVSVWRLISASALAGGHYPYRVAALTGALCVGLTGSVMDVPRVMFLLYWFVLEGVLLTPPCSTRSAEMRKIKP